MRRFFVVAVVLSMFMALATAAGAIGNGTPSTDDRVGALFAAVHLPDGNVDGPFMVCSGSQASDDVFLTAGHCLAWSGGLPPGFGVSWYVTFADQAFDPTNGAPVAPLIGANAAVWDPGFGHDSANLRDYGVVLFEDGTLPGPYVDIAGPGMLDRMKANHELKDKLFDLIGYGTHPEHKEGPPRFFDDGLRYETQAPFKALNQNWLRLHENPDATGSGGACFGDSGSPILVGNTAVAVTTGGTPICRSDAYNQRLDTPEAQAFMAQFLP